MKIVFQNPVFFWLIPIILVFLVWFHRQQKPLTIQFSALSLVETLKPTLKTRFYFVLKLFRYTAIVLMLIAFARPQSVLEETVHSSEGIDIVLTIDASGSMAAEDFNINRERVNRLTIVKNVVENFIDKRENDRIGLITFAGLAYTVCPLTIDYSWLKENLSQVELGLMEDGTAVGSAIASSISRLKESDAKSKIVVLLTDGVNNAGDIDPIQAANVAKSLGIKVYTVGAGSNGYVPFPAKDFFGRNVYRRVLTELDENTLKKVADITGGKYFRATDTESLVKIYDEIDQMEKVEIEEHGYRQYTELFHFFLIPAMLILLLEILLSSTLLLTLP